MKSQLEEFAHGCCSCVCAIVICDQAYSWLYAEMFCVQEPRKNIYCAHNSAELRSFQMKCSIWDDCHTLSTHSFQGIFSVSSSPICCPLIFSPLKASRWLTWKMWLFFDERYSSAIILYCCSAFFLSGCILRFYGPLRNRRGEGSTYCTPKHTTWKFTAMWMEQCHSPSDCKGKNHDW